MNYPLIERDESQCLLQVHHVSLRSSVGDERIPTTTGLRRHIIVGGDWYWASVNSF